MITKTRTSDAIEMTIRPRRIVHRTRGRPHGPIVRLVSPSGVGEMIKPFVFLDYIETAPEHAPAFGFHPHSGIATLTLLLNGAVSYEETTGVKGVIEPGGIEWMRAGGGVWHSGSMLGTDLVKAFQLWVALPPELESSPAESQYLAADQFESHGPARVILGRYGNATSKVSAPDTMNYLDVTLKAGERWHYKPPRGHTVAWIAVHSGAVTTPATVSKGEIAVFEESSDAIEFEARGDDAAFILGSAVKHPHALVLGTHSVHTSQNALERGEANITKIGQQLWAEGRLSPI
jgi:redox-sensitive bicupin YhaK (pirin superfamily)